MRKLTSLLMAVALGCLVTRGAAEDEQAIRVVKYHGYEQAVEISQGTTRVVLCPQVGGRVLEFSANGKQALYLSEEEQAWKPGMKPQATAGRFDYGPELTTIPHPQLWSGEWTSETIGPLSVRLTSPRDEKAGIQLFRDFTLAKAEPDSQQSPRLMCRQTIVNISQEVREVCHWGRSFSPGGGICLVPLAGQSRFPSKYAMYEESAIINVRNTDENIRERDGFLEILAPPRKPKLGFDSYAGWLAYLMPGDVLFVKRFATFPNRVYNEAAGLTLSVWYPPGARIELEPIGPREVLRPGEQATFEEDWFLLAFPFPKAGEQVNLKQLGKLVEKQTSDPNGPKIR